MKKILYSIEDAITDIGFRISRGNLISKDSPLLKMLTKRNLMIVGGIFLLAAIVGGVIGFANRMVIDPEYENTKLVDAYNKNKHQQYILKNQEVILPEKNTPMGRIPKVQGAEKPPVDNQ